MSGIKFPSVSPSISVELRNRVNQYFKDKKIQPSGNLSLYIKSLVLIGGFVTTYICLVFFVKSIFIGVILCVLLGIFLAALGFNIMHDGAHGSFSKYGWLNKIAAKSLDILGGSSFMWNVKHNILHHTYTNIEGLDDDIDIKPFMRMSAEQKRKPYHKFQHYYFWFFYCFLYFFWVYFSDFSKIFTKKIGLMPLKKFLWRDYVYFILMKLIYAMVFIIIPIMQLGWLKFLVGYIIILLCSWIYFKYCFSISTYW